MNCLSSTDANPSFLKMRFARREMCAQLIILAVASAVFLAWAALSADEK